MRRNYDRAKIIIEETCRVFEVEETDLLGPSRRKPLATVRQIAMATVYDLSGLSLVATGTLFGGRDHGTVIHAGKAVSNLSEKIPDLWRLCLDFIPSVKTKLSREEESPGPKAQIWKHSIEANCLCPFCGNQTLFIHPPRGRSTWIAGCESVECDSSWILRRDFRADLLRMFSRHQIPAE